jgi:alginate O-acetyltransferase complex protein AlgI
MTFNSLTFAIFFLCVIFSYYTFNNWVVRKHILLLSSYIFYAAWNPIFILLLWISTLVDWFAAKRISSSENVRKKFWLLLSLSTNLGILAYFKYGHFILSNFVNFFEKLGIHYAPPSISFVLPMGISFYTFQTLSYTIDIYRGKLAPAESFLDYALYVTFFPQLVAGPIVRATHFIPQCKTPKKFVKDRFGWGCIMLTIGLFQKNIVADELFAHMADQAFSDVATSNFLNAWVGTLAFAGQIFCDFSGYSNCAIGAALCLGFALPDNFRFPYAAIGFSDFWRRWHISLSSWLRDYLYIPMGGNRNGIFAQGRNLIFTMLLGGLWHGASWTFVAWGGIHGLLLVTEVGLIKKFGHHQIWHNAVGRRFLQLSTFFLVCITWVFFRATDFSSAFSMIFLMFSPNTMSGFPTLREFSVVVGMLFLVAIHWHLRDLNLKVWAEKMPKWGMSIAIALMLFSVFTIHGTNRGFIYFQF